MTRESDHRRDVPLRIGLTGGIASGKSTVADMFARLGIPVIDTDVIAREVVMPGQPALAEIRARFGADVLRKDGTLDRAAMRKLIFASPPRRRQLEAILHPRIRAAALEQADASGGPYQLIVVPLLPTSSLLEHIDRVLVVDCSEETQLERLMARDAESETHARRILAAQTSRAERLAMADDVIANDGDIDETRRQVLALDRKYRNL